MKAEETNGGMVTLRSNGPELEADGALNYNCDDGDETAEEGSCGAPRAILTCRKNSHPFQDRVLNLDQPVKIGRSVARTRPSPNNGIFDCKVLSRNHALMWYENEKFYIQDTKSSNGTFVNSQRLSRGAEDSPPREVWSGDVLQFGVDVLENQRKGNKESDCSDDSVHIVTHGCIVATLKLIYPNGKEAKPCATNNTQNSTTSYPQEEICKLQLIIFEAQQREERLHGKLEELNSIITMLQDSCHDTLNVRFEETRLLSKIENHEKRTKVMNKIKPGSMEASEVDVVHQLLVDVEKVQNVSQEIQERLHRQLMESEENLTVAKIDANNLQLEVQSLRDLASRSESSVQEIAAKCTNYVQTIENLEARLNTQLKNNMDLESRMEGIHQQEAEFRKFFTQPLNQLTSENLIADEWDEDLPPKNEKECDPIVLEWYDKCYPILKDRINEEESWKLMRRLLETTFADMEQAKKDVEKLSAQKQVLLRNLEAARSPDDKTEIFGNVEGEEEKTGVEATTNETVTQLESQLKDLDDLIWEAAFKKKVFETRCGKIKLDLDTAMNLCVEKQTLMHVEKTDCDDSEMTVEHIRHLVETLRTETEKRDKNYEKLILNKRHDEGTQTDKVALKHKETNTEEAHSTILDPSSAPDNESDMPSLSSYRIEDGNTTIRRNRSKDIKQFFSPAGLELMSNQELEATDPATDEKSDDSDEKSGQLVEENQEDESDGLTEEEITPKKSEEDFEVSSVIEEAVTDARDASRRLEQLLKTAEEHPQSLNMWDKVKRIHDICDRVLCDVPRSAERLGEIKDLLNLVSEDLVALLVREQNMAAEQQQLQDRLNQSLSQADVAALSLAMDVKTISIFSIITIAAYFLISYLFDV